MTTFTKLLAAEAKPAKAILDRSHQLVLTTEQRKNWTSGIETSEGTFDVAVEESRPLYVNDVLLDEHGAFWVVRPAVEKIIRVTGDLRILHEAAGALINRGVDIAQTEDGFAVLALPNIGKMLTMIGLEVKETEAEFSPVRIERQAHEGGCGCGCGCHDHADHDHGCSCGTHHEEEHSCCCNGEEHHHEHADGCGCGCGCHDHDHECSCGTHHEEEHACCCSSEEHHHEHGDGCGCGCGCHDHADHDHECSCGTHHEKEHSCCCGTEEHHHEHGDACGCGCGGHHHHEEKHYKY